MKTSPLLLFPLLLSVSLLFPLVGRGQATVDPGTRVDQLRQMEIILQDEWAPPRGPSETDQPDVEIQDDGELGEQVLLRRQPRHQPFRIFGGANVFHTDNAFLRRNDRRSDQYLVAQVGASFDHPLGDRFFVDAGLRQQVYRYREFPDLDFDNGILSTGLAYVVPEEWGGFILTGRYSLQRLTAARDIGPVDRYGEFLRIHTFSVGAQKIFSVGDYTYLLGGVGARFGATDKFRGPAAADPEKNEYLISLGLRHEYSRSLLFSADYQLSNIRYGKLRVSPGEKREDWSQVAGVGATYKLRPWAEISLIGQFIYNDSNADFFSYHVASVGAGATLTARF